MASDRELTRIASKIKKQPSGCWEWIGHRLPAGYGRTCRNNKHILAHRLVYQTIYGDIPKDMNVLHRCDNKSCVRPDHLFLGNYQDNTDDMIAKRRQQVGDHKYGRATTRSKSLPKGISWDSTNGYYKVDLQANYKRYHRTAHSLEEAKLIRKALELKYWGAPPDGK